MAILSEAQLNNLALMAYLCFGCTCGSPVPEAREAMIRLKKDSDLLFKPMVMALATYHFKTCVYEKQKLIRVRNGELEFKR